MTIKPMQDFDFFQLPNLPAKIATVTSLGIFVFLWSPVISELFAIVAFGTWFTWAWLELFDGTNIFRRVLGGLVIIGLIGVVFTARQVLLG